jgi:soluble lytic murein transglycosylase-like protein
MKFRPTFSLLMLSAVGHAFAQTTSTDSLSAMASAAVEAVYASSAIEWQSSPAPVVAPPIQRESSAMPSFGTPVAGALRHGEVGVRRSHQEVMGHNAASAAILRGTSRVQSEAYATVSRETSDRVVPTSATETSAKQAGGSVRAQSLGLLAEHAIRVMGAETAVWSGLLEPIGVQPDGDEPEVAGVQTDKSENLKQSLRDPAISVELASASDGNGGATEIRASEAQRSSRYQFSTDVVGKGLASDFDSLIEAAARKHDVAPDLVRAVVKVESNFQPGARSPKGAVGLMQLMPATAQRFGVSDPMDPRTNIHAGTEYLSLLLRRFDGDVSLALAAYNAGEGNVEKYGRQIPPFPETVGYVKKVLAKFNGNASTKSATKAAPSTSSMSIGSERVPSVEVKLVRRLADWLASTVPPSHEAPFPRHRFDKVVPTGPARGTYQRSCLPNCDVVTQGHEALTSNEAEGTNVVRQYVSGQWRRFEGKNPPQSAHFGPELKGVPPSERIP